MTAVLKAGPLKIWLTAGAAVAWTVVSAGLIWFFRDRLGTDQAFWIVESALFLVLVAIVALTGTEVSFRAGRDGVSGELGGDAEPPAADPTQYGGPRG